MDAPPAAMSDPQRNGFPRRRCSEPFSYSPDSEQAVDEIELVGWPLLQEWRRSRPWRRASTLGVVGEVGYPAETLRLAVGAEK
jgi:hypothetical protein